MYYRCDPVGKIKEDGNDGAYCYARSEDGGRTFKKPAIHKTTNSNKMAFDDGIHAFSAFIDPRPGIPRRNGTKVLGCSMSVIAPVAGLPSHPVME